MRGRGVRGIIAVVVSLAAGLAGGCSAFGRLGDQVVLAVRGCSGPETVLQGVDWEDAQTVHIRIRQDEFRPMVVGLMRDRPYVLIISNGDSDSHGFRSPEFFRHVAIDQIRVNGEAMAERCITGLTLPAKASAEIRLVALLDGIYPFEDPDELFDLEYEVYEDGDGFGTIHVQ